MASGYVTDKEPSHRLETLPAYDDEELQATGNPVACFSVYIGTNGSNVQYEVSLILLPVSFFSSSSAFWLAKNAEPKS